MKTANAEDGQIAAIWERFVTGDFDHGSLAKLRPIIRDSWLRCRKNGVDARRRSAPTVLSSEQLEQMRRDEPLLSAAEPIARALADAMDTEPAAWTVLDAEARILLQLVPSSKTKDALESLNGFQGSHWSENYMGTDAVSSALLLDQPATVILHEHYLGSVQHWTGCAAPIHDLATGRVLGVISVYGLPAPVDKSLNLVTRAAGIIEREVEMQELAWHSVLHERYGEHLRRFPGAALIGLSASGAVVAASPEALVRLGHFPAPTNTLSRPLLTLEQLGIPNSVLRNEFAKLSGEVQLRHKTGVPVSAELMPVTRNSRFLGFIAILKTPRASTRVAGSAWHTRYTFGDIVGKSDKLRDSIGRAQKASTTDFSVLLIGESGTGKELFAQAIHSTSVRRNGPFVPVNCGAISDELLSSELFGYSEGAFTGALRGGKPGKLELADGGTLFLDEVNSMSPKMQTHLLRVLEDGEITRVGATKPHPIDIRAIAATNVDIKAQIAAGTFRQDLYYRLSGISLHLPSLRDRKGDIAVLTEHLLGSTMKISSPALERLEMYCWPGNVRELNNVLREASVNASSGIITEVELSVLVCPMSCRSSQCPLGISCAELKRSESGGSVLIAAERESIMRILGECGGNISEASSRLGIHRITLHRKMKKHGIRPTFQ